MKKAKSRIAILGTGGTIAGFIDSTIATTGYTAGAIDIDVLIKAVPQIRDLADISWEQIANIDSSNMCDEIWLRLAKKIAKLFAEGIDGVVITHGTDTMEETAYFLNLTIKSDKPVVLVGAMRPSTAISADGPKNLYNAVALVANKEAKNKGVMVAINDKILSARGVVKTHSLNVDAFSSPDFGDLGYIVDGK
ncbi:asparaginase, partial [Campylobacter coli]|nr:asparaginase [Campylobacter coli]